MSEMKTLTVNGKQYEVTDPDAPQEVLVSQGRSAKYNFTSPGWKRVLNIIRGSGGMLNFCLGQSNPLYMAQVAGIVFSGFVKYGNDTSTNAKPVIYQMYNNIFGEDGALDLEALGIVGGIKRVRIGYPDPEQDDYDNGTSSGIKNPINCYLDVYVSFDKDALSSHSVGFQMNYSGFADSHNCEAITAEMEAVDVGIYGEKLLYHELALDEKGGIYMPEWGVRAATVSADSMSVGGKKVLNAGDIDSALSGSSTNPVQNRVIKSAIDAAQKVGKSQVQFAFKSSNVSTPLLFAGISSAESAAYLKDTDTKTPFLDANGAPVDKKEAGAYVMAGVYGDIKTGTLHAKAFDAETDIKIKGKSIIDDDKIGESAWSSKNTVDKLCPTFTESGYVAMCEPVEGYPLEVISTINAKTDGSDWDSITLTQCGKNLFDFKQSVSYVTYRGSGGQGSRYGYSFVLPAGAYTMHAEPIDDAKTKDQYVYCILNDLSGNIMTVDGFGVMKQGTKYFTRTFTLTEPARIFIYNGLPKTSNGGDEDSSNALFQTENNIQIEAGAVATDYEPYQGQTFTADISGCPAAEGSYNWTTGILTREDGQSYQHYLDTGEFEAIEDIDTYTQATVRNIPALPGANYLYSDSGNTTVTGRADPIAIIANQEERLAALEAAIINNT